MGRKYRWNPDGFGCTDRVQAVQFLVAEARVRHFELNRFVPRLLLDFDRASDSVTKNATLLLRLDAQARERDADLRNAPDGRRRARRSP